MFGGRFAQGRFRARSAVEEGAPPQMMSLCEVIATAPALVGELLLAGADPRTVPEGTVYVCASCPGGMCPGPLHRCWEALSRSLRNEAPCDPDRPDGDVPQLVQAFAALMRAGATADTPDSSAGASVASLVREAAASQESNPDDITGELLASIERVRVAATRAGNQLLAAAEQGDADQLAELLWDTRSRHGPRFGHGPKVGDDGEPPIRADPNFQDGAGLSALHWALVRGHAAAARVLLTNGADLQLQDNWGLRCMHAPFAATAAAAAATRVDGENDQGTHPLAHEPAPESSCLHSTLEALIETGKIDADQADAFGGGTLLHYAVQRGVSETVCGLRWNGARSDIEDAQGRTAVELAATDPTMQRALAEVPVPRESTEEPSKPPDNWRCVPFPRTQRLEDQNSVESTSNVAASEDSRASAASALFGKIAAPPVGKSSNQSCDTDSEDGASDDASDATGSDLFDPLDGVITMAWEDLSEEQQDAANILGWRGKNQWADEANMNVRIIDKNFQQLTLAEQDACEVLEITEDDWDDMQVARLPMQSEPQPEPGPEPEPEPTQEQRQSLQSSHRARLLNSDALSTYRTHAISEISSLLHANQHVAMSLLSRHNWDVGIIRSTCADRWFGDERADLLREIGVSTGEAEGFEELDIACASQGETEIECMVCFEDVDAACASRSRCGHAFCNDCWAMHLSDRIAEGELRVACMDTTCKVTVTEQFVRQLAPAESLAKYERFSLAKMIEEHRTGMLKKCRNPACEMTIQLTRTEVGCLEVFCDGSMGGCGCLNCGVPGCWEEAHFPLDCKQVPEWQRKCNEDGGLSGWIKAGMEKAGEGQNTDGVKPCPKCGIYIEKNGACPYMRCGGHAHTQNMEAVNAGVACGCEFCWVCMEIIEPGKGHQCNSYRNKGKMGNKKDQRRTKEDEIKYLSHYYERYEHHHGSRKYIDRDRQAQHRQYRELCEDSTLAVSVDPRYLIDACELLIDARRDLKWSYAAAFFLKPSAQKEFFEFLQGDLEQDVELLAKLLEHGVPGRDAGYESRAVHKTQTTSRMNGVRQKLENLEFHSTQNFESGPDTSGTAAGGRVVSSTSADSNDMLGRRRARKTAASSGWSPDRLPVMLQADPVAGVSTLRAQEFEPEPPKPTCPTWATPCRDGEVCTKRADETHMMQYWHPPAY